ncbi:septal ring lytic transglycosylase RlpA family lipoprotein [Sphingobium sp. SCG-1]|nr:septal ring lytic transglycosylase RlpA family lipoprotein [Sphingobium sp. SCG-1]
MVMLGSCGMIDGQRDGRFRAGSPGRTGSQVADLPVKIGAPYTIAGVTYTPSDVRNYQAVGLASWYGEELNGNRTANGERFEPSAISAAHRTLPLPSYVEVTALSTGRTILLRINDRGPFTQAREIDLSRGAAEQLGILGGGATAVRVRRVDPPEAERAVLRSGRRVAERPSVRGVELAAMQESAGLPAIAPRVWAAPQTLPAKGFYTVQIASFAAKDRAEALAERIGAKAILTGSLWRVGYGPYTTAADARAGVTYAASKGFRDAVIIANDERPTASPR